ncbi:MAG: hemolysin III family protein [Candidatus Thermoplasmatota archaeon]|jgi:hemolysin III
MEATASVDPTERFSFLSHAVGALASIAGLVLLVVKADGPLAVTSCAIYGASLVLLLTASSLHHAIHPANPAGHRTLHLLDHLSIFGLIAGTYTPVSLLGFTPGWGWSIFGVIWAFAVAGTLVRVLWFAAPRWLYTGIYVLMGWTAVVAIVPLLRAFPVPGLLLMLFGGLAYTGGAVIYAMKRPDPWPRWLGFHGLWHIFVLLGAGLHFWFVYEYVV